VFLPSFAILFYFVFEGRPEKWLQVRVDISDGQLDQDFKCIKIFDRIYLDFNQDFMESFIGFGRRLHRDFLSMVIVLDEYRSVVDERPLDRTANLLP